MERSRKKKLLPNGIKRRQLMRRTLPTSLNRPELHLKDECIEMTREETLHFIAEVKKHRCLWDRNDEAHKDKHERDSAWGALSIIMEHNADDLVEKWASLRSSMRQYRCLIRKRKADGTVSRLPFIKWPYFSAMLFTVHDEIDDIDESPVIAPPTRIRLPRADPVDTNATSLKRPKLDETSEEPYSEEMPTSSTTQEVGELVITQAPPPAMVRPVKKSKLLAKPHAKEPEFVAVKVEPYSNPPSPPEPDESHGCSIMHSLDEDEIYGHSIALQLKQFSPKTKRMLRIQIHDLIAKAQKHAFEKRFGVAYDSKF
uniref:MADF domain-containing protein n=1 Tax=Anopheles christyi TaxID=43041 RepID=A0A182JW39_9DIPT